MLAVRRSQQPIIKERQVYIMGNAKFVLKFEIQNEMANDNIKIYTHPKWPMPLTCTFNNVHFFSVKIITKEE